MRTRLQGKPKEQPTDDDLIEAIRTASPALGRVLYRLHEGMTDLKIELRVIAFVLACLIVAQNPAVAKMFGGAATMVSAFIKVL